MRRFLRSTLSELSYQTIRLTNGDHSGVRILTYHRVNDWHPDDLLSVRVANFREQMEYLAANDWRVVPLAQAVEWLAGEMGQGTGDRGHVSRLMSHVPHKAVVLTFDDGYADNYWHAYPILREHEFPATIFIASGLMDRYVPMPRYAKGSARNDRGLSWNEVRTLQASGFEIGAHTLTHATLTALSADEARREIVEGKRQLEYETGRPVAAFAYPRGRCNAAVVHLVREAGFTSACSERVGANRPGEDLFRLRRTEISAFDTLDDFEKKLVGAFDLLHHANKVLSR